MKDDSAFDEIEEYNEGLTFKVYWNSSKTK